MREWSALTVSAFSGKVTDNTQRNVTPSGDTSDSRREIHRELVINIFQGWGGGLPFKVVKTVCVTLHNG